MKWNRYSEDLAKPHGGLGGSASLMLPRERFDFGSMRMDLVIKVAEGLWEFADATPSEREAADVEMKRRVEANVDWIITQSDPLWPARRKAFLERTIDGART